MSNELTRGAVEVNEIAVDYLMEIEAVEAMAIAIERAVQMAPDGRERCDESSPRIVAHQALAQLEGISDAVRAYARQILEDSNDIEDAVLDWVTGCLEIVVIYRKSLSDETGSEPEPSAIELLLTYGGPGVRLTFDRSENGRCDLAVYWGRDVATRSAFCPRLFGFIENMCVYA